MKLLLDEMWTPTIAVEPRKRDLDVIAVNESAQASRYSGISDDTVFARAQDDGRKPDHQNKLESRHGHRRTRKESGEAVSKALLPQTERPRSGGPAQAHCRVRAVNRISELDNCTNRIVQFSDVRKRD